jgi:hypothetical protein
MTPLPIDDKEPATPCGLVAKSFFNDKFSALTKVGDAAAVPVVGDQIIYMNEEGIAWATDKEYKFKNVESYKRPASTEPTKGDNAWKDVQWIDMTNGKLQNN